jgi:hypothetical protein
MHGSDVSSPPAFPLWARIGLACLMFVDAALSMWKHFLRFEWVPWLCMGLYCLLNSPRQRGETFVAYSKKPLGIASIALLIAALVGFGYNLHLLYTK